MMSLGIVPWPLNADLTGYWTMWATVATAAATVGLVVVAWFAWRAALRTLQGQQNNAEITALKDYMNSLHALARLSLHTPPAFEPAVFSKRADARSAQNEGAYVPYVESMIHDVVISGRIWRAFHADVVTGKLSLCEDVLIEAQKWRMNSRIRSIPIGMEQFKINSAFAVEIAGLALRWQVKKRFRAGADLELMSTLRVFAFESSWKGLDYFLFERGVRL